MNLLQRDAKVIWHPFTQCKTDQEMNAVVKGKGVWLTLADGSQVMDVVSSWWVNLHGHAHPAIAEAIYQQALQLEHVMFARYTHEPAVELAELLINAAQERQLNLTRCFYSDNGATAVEIALKMAFQYHYNRGDQKRRRFLALRDGYHGDTIGSMSVSERDNMSAIFKPLLFEVDYIPIGDTQALQKLLAIHGEEYAAFIFEPMVQGFAGMQFYSAEWLQQVTNLCRQHNILLVADEVFTGFYRTGKLFACEHATINPDMICLSKGITGGCLPLSATLVGEHIYNAFLGDTVREAFLHGHSYTGNPLACRAAVKSWELLHTSETQTAIAQIHQWTEREIKKLAQHPRVENARCLGTIGAINIKGWPNYFSGLSRVLTEIAKKQGILLRPLGNALYTVPPYCITEAELIRAYEVIHAILENLDELIDETNHRINYETT